MRKRLFDLALALAGLIAAAPLIAVLMLGIRWGSAGSPLFLQKRVGRDGRIFTCCKLRTMAKDSVDMPTHLANAASITPIGAILRRTKLDELPQLWNIVRGEMSFVGPRPCLPSQNALVEERRRRGVLVLVPGITGVAQVEGIDMSDPVRLAEKDAEYIGIVSLRTDLDLIYRTILKREGQGDRVVHR